MLPLDFTLCVQSGNMLQNFLTIVSLLSSIAFMAYQCITLVMVLSIEK